MLYEQNLQIEDVFSNNKTCTTITLPVNNTEKQIKFIENSVFAKQKDVINHNHSKNEIKVEEYPKIYL